MKQINLLPQTVQRDLRLHFFSEDLIRLSISVFITILICVTLVYVGKAYLSNTLAETEGQITVQRQLLRSSETEALKEEVEGLNNQIKAVKNIQAQHYYWSDALIELDKLLPDDISLDTLTMDRLTGKVEIEGIAGNRESVLVFWADTKKSAYFKDINFPLANLDQATADPFSFTFFINSAKIKRQ